MKEIKTVSLIGIGAAGAFFAPRLYNWLEPGDFRIIAGGKRRELIEKNGITINGIRYDFPIISPEDKVEPADLIIVATKITELEQALEDIKNQVGEDTIILNIQNGLDSEELVAAKYGWEHVLYSYVKMSIEMVNLHTDYSPNEGCIYFGEKNNEVYSEKVIKVRDLFELCHINYFIHEDMIHGLWLKFIANVSKSPASGLLKVPYGAFRTSEHMEALRVAALDEAVMIAKAKGVNITQEEIDAERNNTHNIRYDYKSSICHDLERKLHTEIDSFSGTIVRFGEELGIPTPVNYVFYHAIKAMEEKLDCII